MFSVFLDTIVICTATALMCMCSGVAPSADIAGVRYVQLAASTLFGSGFGTVFVTFSLILFGFTTLIGNLYYCDNAIAFLNRNKRPSKKVMLIFYIFDALVIFVGAGISMSAAWAIADITMAFMCFVNIPACVVLGKVAYKALEDYCRQKAEGRNPVFKAKNIGMDDSALDFWK